MSAPAVPAMRPSKSSLASTPMVPRISASPTGVGGTGGTRVVAQPASSSNSGSRRFIDARAVAGPPRHACARSSRPRTARRRRSRPRPAARRARSPRRSARRRHGRARSGWDGSGSCRRSPARGLRAASAAKPSSSSSRLNTPSNTAIPAARAASTIDLQRHLQRRAPGSGRQAQVGGKIVGAGDQRRRLVRDVVARRARPSAVSIIAATGLPGLVADERTAPPCPRPAARRSASALRMHDRDDVVRRAIRVPAPLIRIATGIGQSSRDRRDRRRRAPLSLSSGFTASSRSRMTRSASLSRALAIARGLLAGRNSSARLSNRSSAHADFPSAARQAVASCAGQIGGSIMLTIFLIAVAVLVLLFVMMSVKIVRQGYRYTIERFGRFVRVAEPGLQPRDAVRLSRRPQDQHDGAGARHPGPGDHHQGQCHGRGRRRGLLPGARRGQGGL